MYIWKLEAKFGRVSESQCSGKMQRRLLRKSKLLVQLPAVRVRPRFEPLLGRLFCHSRSHKKGDSATCTITQESIRMQKPKTGNRKSEKTGAKQLFYVRPQHCSTRNSTAAKSFSDTKRIILPECCTFTKATLSLLRIPAFS